MLPCRYFHSHMNDGTPALLPPFCILISLVMMGR